MLWEWESDWVQEVFLSLSIFFRPMVRLDFYFSRLESRWMMKLHKWVCGYNNIHRLYYIMYVVRERDEVFQTRIWSIIGSLEEIYFIYLCVCRQSVSCRIYTAA